MTGAELKTIRESLNLSAKALAELLQGEGLLKAANERTVRRWEDGSRGIDGVPLDIAAFVRHLDDEASALAALGMALLVSPYAVQDEPETLTLLRYETAEDHGRYHPEQANNPHAYRLHAAGLSRLRLLAKDARLEDKLHFASMVPREYEAWRFQEGLEDAEEARIRWARIQLNLAYHRHQTTQAKL